MKIKLFLCLFLVFSFLLDAQTVHEPNSEIYRDIDTWFVQGYITEFLPLVRPYPAELINRLLDQVIQNGNSSARQRAERYKEYFAPVSRFVYPGVMGYFQGDEEDTSVIAAAFIEGVFHLYDRLDFSYNFAFYGISNNDGEKHNVPGTYSPYPDLIDDTADIGPLRILQNWTSNISYGSPDVYIRAGVSRSSFGPFYDNGVVAGPQAPRAGNISFAYRDPLWSYEMLFQSLVATDDYGMGEFSSKYNIIHALVFRPFRNFEFTAMQSLVYGQRLDLIYMIPFTYLFGAQSINGFMDNAFIGFNFRWRAFNSLLFKGQIYIDDFSFNGLVSGNPYMKAAGQIGVSWAPRDSFLSRLDFDYTAVMPYTYSHWHEPWYDRYNGLSDPSDPRSEPNGRNPLHPAQRIGNYLNYTHLGRNIGPDLEPNSDRIFLRGNIRILSNLEVNISGFLMRHGNASEGKEWLDPDHHDGTIFDSGTTDPWYGNDNPWDSDKNYYKQMYFLTQSNLEILLGGTLGAAWTIPTSFGTFSLSCDYGIQYGWNRGLEKGNNGFNHFWSIGGRWCW